MPTWPAMVDKARKMTRNRNIMGRFTIMIGGVCRVRNSKGDIQNIPESWLTMKETSEGIFWMSPLLFRIPQGAENCFLYP